MHRVKPSHLKITTNEWKRRLWASFAYNPFIDIRALSNWKLRLKISIRFFYLKGWKYHRSEPIIGKLAPFSSKLSSYFTVFQHSRDVYYAQRKHVFDFWQSCEWTMAALATEFKRDPLAAKMQRSFIIVYLSPRGICLLERLSYLVLVCIASLPKNNRFVGVFSCWKVVVSARNGDRGRDSVAWEIPLVN